MPLQIVKDWTQSHFYERYWINRLRSNFRIHPNGLNLSREHTPVTTNRERPIPLQEAKVLSQYVKRHRRSHDSAHKALLAASILTNLPDLLESYLRSLSMRNLHRILNVLCNKWTNPNPASQPPNVETLSTAHNQITTLLTKNQILNLQDLIQNVIDQRTILPKLKKFNTSLPIFTTTYTNTGIQKIGITNMVSKLLRSHFKYLPDFQPKLVMKSSPSLAQLLFNYKSETRNLRINRHLHPDSYPCPCDIPELTQYLNSFGHVSTCSPDIVKVFGLPDTRLAFELISKGAGYIPKPFTSMKLLRKEILASCKEFSLKLRNRYQIPAFKITQFRKELYRNASALLSSPEIRFPKSEVPHQVFKFLKSIFIITPTDKMPKNLNFTCKKHWLESLYNSLSLYPKIDLARSPIYGPPVKPPPHQATWHNLPGPTDLRIPPPPSFHMPTSPPPALAFVLTHKSIKSVIEDHRKYLNPLQFRTYSSLPTKALLQKHHKPGTRPLVTAYRVTTSFLSKHLANALNAVLDALKSKYHDMFFPIKSSRDISTLITALNLSDNYTQDFIRSKDISGCYDNIDHEDLKYVIRDIIPRAFSIMNRRQIKTTFHSGSFTNELKVQTYGTHFFTQSELIDLLCWKVDNTIIQYGPVTLKQNIGIGQGDNHSPQLCNLYLCFYEIQFLDYVKTKQPKFFPLLSLTKRNIDDTLFFSPVTDLVTYLSPTQIGIYPRIYFTLSSTDLFPFEKTNFLDLCIYRSLNPYSHLRNGNMQPLNLHSLSESKLRTLSLYLNLPHKLAPSRLIYNLSRLAISKLPTKKQIWMSTNYNKVEDFPTHLSPIQYLNFKSLHPESVKRAIIQSRLHSILHTSIHNPTAFILSTIELATKLVWDYQYPPRMVHQQIKRFLSSSNSLYHLTKKNICNLLFSNYRELYFQALQRSSSTQLR